MPESENSRKDNTEIKAAILKEFFEQMFQKGYTKTTLKKVAENLNISTGHLSYYFSKKEDLLIALAKDNIVKIKKVLNSYIKTDTDPLMFLLLSERLLNHIKRVIPENTKIHVEISTSPALIIETARILAVDYESALNGKKKAYDPEKIFLGLHAKWSTYHALFEMNKPVFTLTKEDDEWLFEHCLEIFFMFIDFPRNKTLSYINESKAIFDKFDKQLLTDQIYHFDRFDFG